MVKIHLNDVIRMLKCCTKIILNNSHVFYHIFSYFFCHDVCLTYNQHIFLDLNIFNCSHIFFCLLHFHYTNFQSHQTSLPIVFCFENDHLNFFHVNLNHFLVFYKYNCIYLFLKFCLNNFFFYFLCNQICLLCCFFFLYHNIDNDYQMNLYTIILKILPKN
jgi:hypothetical protein